MLFACVCSGAQIHVVTELFYPYQHLNQDNELDGYAVEVVERLAVLAGDTLQIEILPWSVAYQRALSAPDVLIFSIGKNAARAPEFAWIGPIARERLYFWALPSAGIPASDSLSDFRNLRIAVIKDATTHEYLRSSGFDNLYVMSGTDSNVSEENRIRMLLRSRADIVIASPKAIQTALQRLELPENTLTKVFRATQIESELYVAFNHRSQAALIARYQQAMQTLKSTGELRALKQKWKIH